MPALATWTPEDELLGSVAPLALAASAGTALVVDLDPAGPAYPGRLSLAELVAEGPRRVDLAPRRSGVAVLPNGGIGPTDATPVVAALVAGWPSVVLRRPAVPPPEAMDGVVWVRPLAPALRVATRPAVYQRGPWRIDPPGPGLVVPRVSAARVAALLGGRQPRRGRWISGWREVWARPWV